MIPQSRVSGQIRKIKAEELRRQALLAGVAPTEAPARRKPFTALSPEEARAKLEAWFGMRGWKPYEFQTRAWDAFRDGRPHLIAVPTGSGKTYAAFGGPLIDLLSDPQAHGHGPRVIYVTPLKALARDIAQAIALPLKELGLPFRVGLRTGDTSARERRDLTRNAPEILVTTPESLAILLTGATKLGGVRAVIVDEWHELLGTKRGSLLELTLARLRFVAKELRVSALSATLGNLPTAARVALGSDDALIITDERTREVRVESVLPRALDAAPYFGYAGLRLIDELIARLDPEATQIIFTNTRAAAEAWFRELAALKPEWGEILALHHGSLAREERARIEEGAKSGALKIIVATSSLELGVDFPRVGRVFQIGAVKSLARAVQRAGRGFHRPGEASLLTVLPTSLFEILEVRALRSALEDRIYETKETLYKPLDVLAQFILNCAFGEGVTRADLRAMVSTAYSFRDVTDRELDWLLGFLETGGSSLAAYPQFLKLRRLGDRYVFADTRLAGIHRRNIGTIVSDDGVLVRFATGKTIGTVGETFAAKLKRGDVFQLSGKELEVVQFRDQKLLVRLAWKETSVATVWSGAVLPISPLLAVHFRRAVEELAVAETPPSSPEPRAFWPAAVRQKQVSAIPRADETLLELWKSREGHHLFLYPFAGRIVHEGLGHLFAYRIAKAAPNTIAVAANDYGIELLAAEPFPDIAKLTALFSTTDGLVEDVEASLNFPELAKRAFREVARVSGLIQTTASGGKYKSQGNLQMSSTLLHDVFAKYDPDNLLLRQARAEVRSVQLRLDRLEEAVAGFARRRWLARELARLSPFAFPLYVERVRTRVSTESLEQRIARFQRQITEG